MADVAVIAGSASDKAIIDKVVNTLAQYALSYDMQILSAHRDAEKLDAYVKKSDAKVFICIAGMSAALPGVVAARTTKPVIGVPVSGKLAGGLDALLSIAQMPKGVPVACMALDGGENAAHMAHRILSLLP
ncbi:5-(carboxyamino)imidazole ribonucleotide mutase [Methanocorpusculum vombati]|uniref:5-(Carboxyamino)imidazole ribonucleotide mutase n=1 Tax=Methanocorpusculum vombati TaxID=3002864 RepID=A0ABT4IJD8_9EURY|nr:AIR carboxylase family protein [Methanocorpusculum vombati]MCZ9318751.1 5-(carboxyamino)imidazole ribonucleotide mutase [Methanocorpusculum sp.]MCZ0861865.1 5-(carboxyamino)imidazole ribonucleotide mutase [Methanocorpusculum vombati]MDE2521165.1 5-(carboxyamino)imidazole ribonucleotide mutase [Methanocorpusculum sp.]MDE2534902.1 5-(carboxyamino)imidazole ribonucleotide mutase [Methanocorpusculum sp.]MDE2545449.1 5-(carboxyamino)imidazole ribonucleotide mutase [Methanocorpusculum sp.]